MKPMQHAVNHRRKDNAGRDQEQQTTVERIACSEELACFRLQFCDRAHAPKYHRRVQGRIDPRKIFEVSPCSVTGLSRRLAALPRSATLPPLSGLEKRPLAPLWHKMGHLIFTHGENFYNFEGLRNYKNKFDPTWQPRYLASPGGWWHLPHALVDVSRLISGGVTRADPPRDFFFSPRR